MVVQVLCPSHRAVTGAGLQRDRSRSFAPLKEIPTSLGPASGPFFAGLFVPGSWPVMNPLHGGRKSFSEPWDASHVKLVGSILISLTAFRDLHDD